MDGQGLTPSRGKIFLFPTASRPGLKAYLAPYTVVLGAIALWVKLPTHLYLVVEIYLHSPVSS
jgi:hypothetical protein